MIELTTIDLEGETIIAFKNGEILKCHPKVHESIKVSIAEVLYIETFSNSKGGDDN